MCLFLYLFCSSIFWLVFHVICDNGPFPHRVFSKLGSAWHGSTTTLDAKRLWRCSWLSSVPQQQTPSSMPPLAYATYAMGSPQVGFFFRVEPPIIYILYMFGDCSGVCFLLLGAELDAIFTYGGSTFGVCTLVTLWSLPMAGICATW